MMQKKAQSAMEYLMTYGWAILIIAVVLAILYQLGIFGGSSALTGTSCLAATGYLCSTPQLNTEGNLIVQFGQVGQTITLTGIACTNNPVPPSALQNVAQTQLATGQTIPLVFNCPLSSNSIGSKFTGYLWVQYNSQTNIGNIGKVGAITAVASTTQPVSATTSTTTSTTTTSTTTINPPIIDTYTAAGSCCSEYQQITPTFSTTNANDIIIVIVSAYSGSIQPYPPTVSDTAGLTWINEYGGANGIAGCGNAQTWVYYAMPGHTVSNDRITGEMDESTLYIGAFVIAVQNVNSWDPNVSLPSDAVNGGTTVSTAYSTTNPNDFVIGEGVECNGDNVWNWNGMTQLNTVAAGAFSDAYKITSSTQTGATAGFTSGSSWVSVMVGAASST